MDLPTPLPPTEMRRGGGPLKYNDKFFVESAVDDAHLLTAVGLEENGRLIDFGCGPGRLAIGLIRSGWIGSYLGVEVNEAQVRWTSAEITSRFPEFRFVRVDAANARYNPRGSETPRVPVDNESVDMICAFSVFTHMLSDDTVTYLREFRRALDIDGRALITAFMADGVPEETENPPWLGESSGRLHRILYSTEYLRQLIETAGLKLVEVVPRANREQTTLLLRPA